MRWLWKIFWQIEKVTEYYGNGHPDWVANLVLEVLAFVQQTNGLISHNDVSETFINISSMVKKFLSIILLKFSA